MRHHPPPPCLPSSTDLQDLLGGPQRPAGGAAPVLAAHDLEGEARGGHWQSTVLVLSSAPEQAQVCAPPVRPLCTPAVAPARQLQPLRGPQPQPALLKQRSRRRGGPAAAVAGAPAAAAFAPARCGWGIQGCPFAAPAPRRRRGGGCARTPRCSTNRLRGKGGEDPGECRMRRRWRQARNQRCTAACTPRPRRYVQASAQNAAQECNASHPRAPRPARTCRTF